MRRVLHVKIIAHHLGISAHSLSCYLSQNRWFGGPRPVRRGYFDYDEVCRFRARRKREGSAKKRAWMLENKPNNKARKVQRQADSPATVREWADGESHPNPVTPDSPVEGGLSGQLTPDPSDSAREFRADQEIASTPGNQATPLESPPEPSDPGQQPTAEPFEPPLPAAEREPSRVKPILDSDPALESEGIPPQASAAESSAHEDSPQEGILAPVLRAAVGVAILEGALETAQNNASSAPHSTGEGDTQPPGAPGEGDALPDPAEAEPAEDPAEDGAATPGPPEDIPDVPDDAPGGSQPSSSGEAQLTTPDRPATPGASNLPVPSTALAPMPQADGPGLGKAVLVTAAAVAGAGALVGGAFLAKKTIGRIVAAARARDIRSRVTPKGLLAHQKLARDPALGKAPRKSALQRVAKKVRKKAAAAERQQVTRHPRVLSRVPRGRPRVRKPGLPTVNGNLIVNPSTRPDDHQIIR